MEGLPYYASIGANGFQELVDALQAAAETEDLARAAVGNLLADLARASSPETNRVPSPGELRAWVSAVIDAERNVWKSPPPLGHCFRCSGTGKVGQPGWKPDWSMTAEQIDATCEAAKVPCPDCQDAIEWEPDVEPAAVPMPVARECCSDGISVVSGRAEYCGCEKGEALRNRNRVMAIEERVPCSVSSSAVSSSAPVVPNAAATPKPTKPAESFTARSAARRAAG